MAENVGPGVCGLLNLRPALASTTQVERISINSLDVKLFGVMCGSLAEVFTPGSGGKRSHHQYTQQKELQP